MNALTNEVVLVTGASGFIGSHLCARLVAEGARVHGVFRRTQPPGTENVIWHSGDLADGSFTDTLLAQVKPRFVFHLASYVAGARELDVVPVAFRDILQTSVNVLVAAARHGKPRVILTGSMEEPEPGDAPSSPYAAAKLAAAGYAAMFHALYQLPVVNARVFMVYGPGQRDLRKLVPYVILSLLRREPPKVSSGERMVDWIYVDDVVEGLCVLARTPGIEGRRLDLGTGRMASVREVVEHLVGIVAPEVRPEFGAVPTRPLEQIRYADVETTRRLTGWHARVPLEEGLRRTAEWYRERVATGAL